MADAPPRRAEPDAERRRRFRPPNPWNAVRPTVAGVWFVLVLGGLLFGAVNTGNNLVYVVLATLLAVLLVNNVLAEWNLRALVVRRVLPPELFAGTPAAGVLVLENPRRLGTAWAITVEERDGGGALARFARVPPGESAGQRETERSELRLGVLGGGGEVAEGRGVGGGFAVGGGEGGGDFDVGRVEVGGGWDSEVHVDICFWMC
jgi:hypothetical protein